MIRWLLLLAVLPLGGCVAAWEQEPSGIYPHRVATLNGPPIWFLGWKASF